MKNLKTKYVTICRHIICDKCVKILFNRTNNINCPFCRTKLTKNDINYTSVDKLDENEESPSNELENSENTENVNTDEEKIKKYGTKLAYLLDYLGEFFGKNPDNRIIIFSQYDQMLKLIGGVLDDFKIKNLFIKGNIMSVTKKIDKFKSDPSYRVIGAFK